jgi:hypothetical protein
LHNCCVGKIHHQTGCCFCIYEIHKMMKRDEEDYALVCEEISTWLNTAAELEAKLDAKEFTKKTFQQCFQHCVDVKEPEAGGTFTHMVQMSVLPKKQKKTDVRGWGDHGEEKYGHLSHSTMCKDSLLFLWRLLFVNGADESENKMSKQWMDREYSDILSFYCLKMIDESNQREKQRLFYTRIKDFVGASQDAKVVAWTETRRTFREKGWIPKHWKENEWKTNMQCLWSEWKLSSINIVMANSNMEYNNSTSHLVRNLGVKLHLIQDETVTFLHNFGMELQRVPKGWRKVSRDKKLNFFPIQHCHNIRSAREHHFGEMGDGSLVGRWRNFVDNDWYRYLEQEADREIEEALLKMLEDEYGSVGFQPSWIFSKVHSIQEAHVDYERIVLDDQTLNFMVAFLPLTERGQFLQVWDESGKSEEDEVEGEIIFIPKGHLALVPGNVMHGGGFRAETREGGPMAHHRLHFYVYPGNPRCMIDRHKNDYRDECFVGKYVPNRTLSGKDRAQQLKWTFFQGLEDDER